MATKYEPISREDVKKALEGGGPVRPPTCLLKWPGEGLREYHGDALDEVLSRYPDDILLGGVQQPGGWEAPEGFDPEYRWGWRDKPEPDAQVHGHDGGGGLIYDWSVLDEFLATFPKADDPKIWDGVRQAVANGGGRYVLAAAWNNFYERLWGLRGMQQVLMDFHLYPKELHALCEALCEFVLGLVDGAAEAGADGFFTSNDLGHQTGLMMSPESFRKFLKPLHRRVADACHGRGLTYWMHSCGDLTDVLEDMIEVGLDVLHPLQYGVMDWQASSRILRGRMTAWPGIDVQHILQEADPKGVRAHVREAIDAFQVPGRGGCVVAAGNGITGSTPLENIDAFWDETFRYGLTKGPRSAS